MNKAKLENQKDIAVNDELIARYLAGEADADEAVVLHDWLKHPANKSHFEGARSAWYAARPQTRPRAVNTGEAWQALEQKLGSSSQRRRVWPYLSIAASVLLLITAGLWYAGRTEAVRPNVVSTRDSVRQIMLADRSFVTLNRHSSISFGDFPTTGRRVTLVEGEGFFNVTADPSNPFVVHTALGDIRVIGTAFNVALDKDHLEVSVKEGSVVVTTDSDSVALSPGFRAEIVQGARSVTVAQGTDLNDWGYATGLFVFRNTPLDKVIKKIKKSHPVLIEIANPGIYRCRLTATFEDVTAEDIIYLMAETLNLSVTRNGNKFMLEGEGCP